MYPPQNMLIYGAEVFLDGVFYERFTFLSLHRFVCSWSGLFSGRAKYWKLWHNAAISVIFLLLNIRKHCIFDVCFWYESRQLSLFQVHLFFQSWWNSAEKKDFIVRLKSLAQQPGSVAEKTKSEKVKRKLWNKNYEWRVKMITR